ncbi:hypothetical protein NM208_g2345 [Fusarium decemcellulare]|uniref:Uncharacterized protein n=1 Tax=Fusarium decemcellulare TaxID=57161 RepID=A0ACC1ST07_9HYPO|nr:hypothetical protein NM208_g2345 [Fusarium decemcellulare]
MVMRDVTRNITTFSVPFARQGIFNIGGRGTLVRLSSGAVAIFSPVALTQAVLGKIQDGGNRLDYIIAPDLEHHIFISQWKSAFPSAKIIGPEGLPEKRAKQRDDYIQPDEFSTVFKAATKRDMTITPEFDADFEYEYVDAHMNRELVFFYKPDRVLIEADLLFNLPAVEQYSKAGLQKNGKLSTLLNKAFNAVFTTEGDLTWLRRFQWYITASKDRAGFAESIKRINDWDFHTIIPCHGGVIELNAKEKFQDVFQWQLHSKQN